LNVLWAVTFWLVRWTFLWNTDGRHHARTLAVLQALTLAGAAASWWVAFGKPTTHTDWRLPHWFVYAALGSAAYWAVESVRWRWLAAALAAALLVGGGVAATPRPALAVASTTALLWLTVRPVRWNWFGWGAVSAVGRWSYSVYLVHGIVGYRTLTAVRWAGVPTDGVWTVVHFATAIGVSVAAGWVFFRLVESPVLKWSQGIRYRGQ
jgi:peptidoglycan/LPS O-acetylase OafA/YrhL